MLSGKGIELSEGGKICPMCKEEIEFFSDKYYYDEFLISGMCESCQESIFNTD